MSKLECSYPWAPSRFNTEFARCGQCRNCRIHHQLQWESRMKLECAYNPNWPMFVTATYKDEPSDENQCVEYGKLFFKRFRRIAPLRYFHCVERGSNNKRLHHHMIIWSQYLSELPITQRYQFINNRWGHGRTNVAPVKSPAAFAYVAKYVTKGSLKYTWSQKPSIGAVALKRWRYLVTELHSQIPFDGIERKIPACLNKNVLNQAHSIRIPERDLMRLSKNLGVRYAPDNNKAVRLLYKGVPNGPLDLERLRRAIKLEEIQEV